MARRAPEIVEGLRSPDMDLSSPQPESPRPALDLPEGTVEYVCPEFAGAWFTLADPEPMVVMTPSGPQTITPQKVTLKFSRSRAITADPQVIHRVEGCPAGCPLHPLGLPPHPKYGLGKTFWRADKAAEASEQAALVARRAAVKAALTSDPKLVEDVLREMNAESFALPERAGESAK